MQRRPRSRRNDLHAVASAVATAAAMTMMVVLAGCGITADSAPRDIEPATQTDSPAEQDDTQNSENGNDSQSGQNSQAAIGNGIVFLVDQTGGVDRLVSVKRTVEASIDRDPSSALNVLFAGPNGLERADGITTVLPEGLSVLRSNSRGGVVTIDLPGDLRELTGEPLTLGLAQIVYTISAVEGVTSVRITIDGAAASWPDAYGQLQTDPLTVYDYPGLVSSTQPAFPAVPSD